MHVRQGQLNLSRLQKAAKACGCVVVLWREVATWHMIK